MKTTSRSSFYSKIILLFSYMTISGKHMCMGERLINKPELSDLFRGEFSSCLGSVGSWKALMYLLTRSVFSACHRSCSSLGRYEYLVRRYEA
jgi:hypothetical protein